EVAAGPHTYTARAVDDKSAATDSAPVSVMVQATQAFAFSVTSMTLIDTNVGQAVAGFDPIPNNANIAASATMSIRCNTTGTLASLKFSLDATDNYHVEGNLPYAMQGDNGAGVYTPIA